MRRFLRAAGATAAILLAAACGLMFLLLLHAPVFEGGENYTYYLGANSSARAVVSEDPVLDKLLLGRVAGESVQYPGDRYEALKARFRAELLFTEEACGVTNYYLRSPLLGAGIVLGGRRVNLHIAVGGGKTVAGTPIVFGGF